MEKKKQSQLPKNKKKFLFILIDGLSDISYPELGGATCLQKEDLPLFNAVASTGLNGIQDPVQPGLSCGSDTAHMQILGYDPLKLYRGRGAFQTLGTGDLMKPSDIGFKSNFATMDNQSGIVTKRRADRSFEKWGIELCSVIDGLSIPIDTEGKYKVSCTYATQHRCGVKISGPGLSSAITGTDPIKDNRQLLKCRPLDPDDKEAQWTSDLVRFSKNQVNSLSGRIREVLSAHPLNIKRKEQGLPYANVILLRGCGQRLSVETFEEKYKMKGFMIAPTCIIKGFGISIGMDIAQVKGATGGYDSDYYAKSKAALQLLFFGSSEWVHKILSQKPQQQPNYDFCFLHIKGIDDTGHDKKPQLKVKLFHKLNDSLERAIKETTTLAFEKDPFLKCGVCLTGDHSTLMRTGEHSFEPVPFAISELSNVTNYIAKGEKDRVQYLTSIKRKDEVNHFDEVSAGKGLLGRFSGSEIMPLIQNYLSMI